MVKVTLIVTDGPIKGRSFVFEQPQTLRFGRENDCDVSLGGDKRTSRYHFELEVESPEVRLYDLGSLHGTWVNGVKYGGRQRNKKTRAGRQHSPVLLFDGDTIQVGRHRMRVEIEVKVEVPSTIILGSDQETLFDEKETIITEQALNEEVRPDEQKTVIGEYSWLSERRQQQEQANKQADPAPKPSPAEEKGLTQPDTEILFDYTQAAKALATLLNDLGMNSLQESRRLRTYRIYKQLGKGAFGHVYLARHLPSKQWVALKTMRPTENYYAPKAFQREIGLARNLQHPHIVNLLENGTVGHNLYFIMEFCDGGDLIQLMRHYRGPIPLPHALPLMQQILQGLAFMHLKGIVHRDLKPSNILLMKRANGIIPKIGDLGLAKAFISAGLADLTTVGMKGGTRSYMSPEQLKDFKYTKPISDVWSIGATFYFILTGHKPRQAPPNLNWQIQISQGTIIPIRQRAPHMPREIAHIIDRALSLDINVRYKTAAHMLDALEKVLR